MWLDVYKGWAVCSLVRGMQSSRRYSVYCGGMFINAGWAVCSLVCGMQSSRRYSVYCGGMFIKAGCNLVGGIQYNVAGC